ncbi:MAG: hypothetical protein ACI9U2_003017 [Bradymonadia bacterium]|jgi:hypothetical protein
MQLLAVSKMREDADRSKMGPQLLSEEVKHTLEAYLDGHIRNFWFKAEEMGIVLLLESADKEEAQRVLGELPLVIAGIIEFDLTPLKPLTPLGMLIGRKMS